MQQHFRGLSQQGSLSPSSPNSPAEAARLAQSLTVLEQRLQSLRRAVDNLVQLRQIQATVTGQQQARQASAELEQLQRQADQLEAELLTQLATWQQVSETFWQAVRFGGLGILTGWLLNSWIGG